MRNCFQSTDHQQIHQTKVNDSLKVKVDRKVTISELELVLSFVGNKDLKTWIRMDFEHSLGQIVGLAIGDRN